MIAAVEGYAVGGGAELALACDLTIAAPSARFRFPEVTLGFAPGGGATARLPAAVGLLRAKELPLTGRWVPADEAVAIGLANELSDAPSARARALARAITDAAPPHSLSAAKRLLEVSGVPRQDVALQGELDAPQPLLRGVGGNGNRHRVPGPATAPAQSDRDGGDDQRRVVTGGRHPSRSLLPQDRRPRDHGPPVRGTRGSTGGWTRRRRDHRGRSSPRDDAQLPRDDRTVVRHGSRRSRVGTREHRVSGCRARERARDHAAVPVRLRPGVRGGTRIRNHGHGTRRFAPPRSRRARHRLPDLFELYQEPLEPADVSPDDLACLLFTSGTTGRSKACMLPHRYFVVQAQIALRDLGWGPDDVLYCPFPLFHIDCTVFTVMPALLSGATAAVGRRFSASRFWAEVRAVDATVIEFMGATLTILAKAEPSADDRKPPSATGLGSAGTRLGRSVRAAIWSRATRGVRINRGRHPRDPAL